MTLTFGYSPWFLVASLILAASLSYWAYRRTVPSLRWEWRALLGGLRFLALSLALFLLLEPVAEFFDETTEPPLLAVLVDNTESMRLVTKKAESTTDSARASVDRLLTSLSNDLQSGAPEVFAFDEALQRVPADSLTFSGPRTDIGAPLEQLPNRVQGKNLKGVVLVSDGQFNTGTTPLRTADRYPVPIHTVTVGDTTRQRDAQVRRVVTNDRAYTDTDTPVRALIRAANVNAESVTVTLSAGDSLVDETAVRLSGETAEVPVDLTYRADTPGLQQLTVRVSEVPGEVTTQNNVQMTSLRVLDRKRQVLLLGAAPSPSFAAVRRALENDANTELSARVPRRDGGFYGGALPDTLSRYDALVLAGFPGPSVSPDAVDAVVQVLDDGMPAAFLLDSQTDLSAWNVQFGPHLPARPNKLPLEGRSASIAVTNPGTEHPLFRTEGVSPQTVSDLPPLTVPRPAWTPTPDAQVLAVAERSNAADGDPVLMVRRRAGHRTALFLGMGAWRWATLPPALRAADPLWPGLMNNLLRWTATQDAEEQVQVTPTAAQFEGDESVSFTGQVYDESMSPLSSATVEVTLSDSTGPRSSHRMDPIGEGRYELDLGALPKGAYTYEAVAKQSTTPIGADQGAFSIGAPRREFQSTRPDPALMRQIAERSGGRPYTSKTASSLAADVAKAPSFTAEVERSTREVRLWDRWPLLAFLLVLLATEWTLRKRLGLP